MNPGWSISVVVVEKRYIPLYKGPSLPLEKPIESPSLRNNTDGLPGYLESSGPKRILGT